jgi:hypothetical protein
MRISRSYGLMAFALTGLLAFGSSMTQAQAAAQTAAPAAQAASPNADLLAMLKAGAAEKVVLARIVDGAGHWDTTPDALAELRKAGATEPEIKALSDGTTLATGSTRATTAPSPGLQAGISATGNQVAQRATTTRPLGQATQSQNQQRATATPGAGVPTGITVVPTNSRTMRAAATPNVSATNKPSAPVVTPAASDKVPCPASGFVPGVKRAVSAGTWAPVACTAGAAIYVAGQPQFDTACTNTTAGGNGKGPTCPAPSSSAGTSAAPASDGVPVSGPGSQVAGVASCIKTTGNDDGTINFQNTCPTKVVYTWAPQTPGAGDPLSEDGTLDPGETRKSSTAPAGGGGYGYYACPAGYVPQDTQKQAVSQYVTGYACVKQ